jgi:hypothetical protein
MRNTGRSLGTHVPHLRRLSFFFHFSQRLRAGLTSGRASGAWSCGADTFIIRCDRVNLKTSGADSSGLTERYGDLCSDDVRLSEQQVVVLALLLASAVVSTKQYEQVRILRRSAQ